MKTLRILALTLMFISTQTAHAKGASDCLGFLHSLFKVSAESKLFGLAKNIPESSAAVELFQKKQFQEAIWELRREGVAPLAEKMNHEFESALKDLPVIHASKLVGDHQTEVYRVTLKGGIKGVFKPYEQLVTDDYIINGVNLVDSRREVLAYHFDQGLDLGMVPTTVERIINGKRGSLQAFVPSTPLTVRVNEMKREIRTVQSYDYLIRNIDRNRHDVLEPHNLLYARNHVVAYDHAMAFQPNRVPKATNGPYASMVMNGMPLNEQFYLGLKNKLTPEKIRKISEGKLSETIIREIIERRTELMEYHERLVGTH